MLEFKCPICGTQLAIGHPEVNPVAPTPPFTYWRTVPRGFNAQVRHLHDVPADVSQVMDEAANWWRRDAADTWSQINPPDNRLVAGEPPFTWFVKTGEKLAPVTAMSSHEIPDDVTEMFDSLGRQWTRGSAAERWRAS